MENLTLRLNTDLKTQLAQHAKTQGYSLSGYIRHVLAQSVRGSMGDDTCDPSEADVVLRENNGLLRTMLSMVSDLSDDDNKALIQRIQARASQP